LPKARSMLAFVEVDNMLKWHFCKIRPLLVDFKKHTRAQKTRGRPPRLRSPRMLLKTH
jgi:hypothetical protein